MPFELDNDFENIVQIKVIGVGGGGGNAIDRMVTYRRKMRRIYLSEYRPAGADSFSGVSEDSNRREDYPRKGSRFQA